MEPIDDFRATNPATHPKLMDRLAADFRDHEFDFRHTIQLICQSETYQRSSIANEGNETDFEFLSHAPTRELSAEVLADAISHATGVSENYDRHAAGEKAIELHKPGFQSEFLQILGRCTDEKTCEIGTTITGGIARQLQMINGAILNRRIEADDGRLQQLLDSGQDDSEIVDELYLRCLTRQPKPDERKFWLKQIDATKSPTSRVQLLQDLYWSLLTCREFLTNH